MILLEDNFVDADGTLLTAHTPDVGGPYLDIDAGMKIESNAAVCDAGTSTVRVALGKKTGRVTAHYQGVDIAHQREFTVALGSDDTFNLLWSYAFTGYSPTSQSGIAIEDDLTFIEDGPIPVVRMDTNPHILVFTLGITRATLVMDGVLLAQCRALPFASRGTNFVLQLRSDTENQKVKCTYLKVETL